MGKKIITIFGTARAKPGEPIFEIAYQAGTELARAGFAAANGGYGGTMLAAAKGASESGGEVIGVTCSAFGNAKANQYISREIITNCLDERLEKLIELGSAYIVLPGGTGTLLELAKVWELKNKGFMPKDKSIIIIGDFWRNLLNSIAQDDADSIGFLDCVKNPKEAVNLLKLKLGSGNG